MSEQTIFVPTRLPPWGIYAIYRFIEFLFFVLARVHISGRENFPAMGNYLFVSNHLSTFDVGLGLVVLQGDRASRAVVFAGDTWRNNPATRFILQLANVIWVHRGETSPSTIKTALRVLREGYILGVAPEGTRSRDSHALIKGHTGAAYLALSANVPIVPIGIANTENLWPSLTRLHRIDIGAMIGKPFMLEPCVPESRINQACLEKSTDEIMCRIAALLPPQYRGEYAEHPRLKELLLEKTPTRIE